MQENTFKISKVKAYTKTLSNGLDIIMVPDKKKDFAKASFITRFGGKDLAFRQKGETKYTEVPVGIAHFLEHKMFESKARDVSVYDFFDEMGASSNAYTDKNVTAYYFETDTNFEKCLDFLLDFVQAPNLTVENVEKEKGIIGQEIEMGDNNYSNFMYDLINYNLFHTDSNKYSIDGTYEDIESINKDLLMKCYDVFYHPKNMILVITGNFDPTKTLKLVEENQKKKKFKPFKQIERKKYEEKDEVFKKEETVSFNVENDKVIIAYKIPLKKIKLEKKVIEEYINLILNINFSGTSIYRENLEEQEITEGFWYDFFTTDNHLIILFEADTKDYKKFLESIKNKVTNLEVDNKLLEIKKRSAKASYVSLFDSPIATCAYLSTFNVKNKKIDFNEIDLILNTKLENLQDFMSKLDFSNYSVVRLMPKK